MPDPPDGDFELALILEEEERGDTSSEWVPSKEEWEGMGIEDEEGEENLDEVSIVEILSSEEEMVEEEEEEDKNSILTQPE